MNGFLDPTKVGQFPTEVKEGGIRRVLTARDTPGGIPHATDPTPEDLVATFDDYRIGPGDGLGVSVSDLIGPGDAFNATLEVSPAGDIRLPQLGSVRLAGLTEQEAEQELKTRLQEAGILPNPIIIVVSQLRRGRVFSIVGSVGAAGTYPIGEPDLRLLDAISLARDIGPEVKKIYVIRRAPRSIPPIRAPYSPAGPTTPLAPTPTIPADGLLIQPEDLNDPSLRFAFSTTGGIGHSPQPQRSPRYARADDSRSDLDEAIAPTRPGRRTTAPSRVEARPESDRPFAPLIFDPETGSGMPEVEEVPSREVMEPAARRPATPTTTPTPTTPTPTAPPGPSSGNGNGNGRPFNWDDFSEHENSQRVIAIDVRALKQGDPRYNIVVRDRDIINVPVDLGVYYLMGEVNRPGVYSFGGREVTIKQALASAGSFAPLAWPKRAEVIRREQGTDKQTTISVDLDKIFAGLEDDFFLRDEDIVNVGSDFIAPFLFVVRNSFRFTYGFGFVYDRNFADKDSYNVQTNPTDLRRFNSARRGLPF